MARVPKAFILTLDILNDGGYRGFYKLQRFSFLRIQDHLISEHVHTFERYQEMMKNSIAHSTLRDLLCEKRKRLSASIEFDPSGGTGGICLNASTDFDQEIIKEGLKGILKRKVWTRRRRDFT